MPQGALVAGSQSNPADVAAGQERRQTRRLQERARDARSFGSVVPSKSHFKLCKSHFKLCPSFKFPHWGFDVFSISQLLGAEILHPSPRHLSPPPPSSRCLQPVRVGVLTETLSNDDAVAVASRAFLQLPCPPQVTESQLQNAFFNMLLTHRWAIDINVSTMPSRSNYDDAAFMPEVRRTTSFDLSPALRPLIHAKDCMFCVLCSHCLSRVPSSLRIVLEYSVWQCYCDIGIRPAVARTFSQCWPRRNRSHTLCSTTEQRHPKAWDTLGCNFWQHEAVQQLPTRLRPLQLNAWFLYPDHEAVLSDMPMRLHHNHHEDIHAVFSKSRSSSWKYTCVKCGVECQDHRRKGTTFNCRTPKPEGELQAAEVKKRWPGRSCRRQRRTPTKADAHVPWLHLAADTVQHGAVKKGAYVPGADRGDTMRRQHLLLQSGDLGRRAVVRILTRSNLPRVVLHLPVRLPPVSSVSSVLVTPWSRAFAIPVVRC